MLRKILVLMCIIALGSAIIAGIFHNSSPATEPQQCDYWEDEIAKDRWTPWAQQTTPVIDVKLLGPYNLYALVSEDGAFKVYQQDAGLRREVFIIECS